MYTLLSGGPTSTTYRLLSVTLLPQVAGYVACYYYYPLGDRIRVFAELGWSLSFTQNKIRANGGQVIDELSSEYQNLVLFYSPGGPLLAGGLSFGIRK